MAYDQQAEETRVVLRFADYPDAPISAAYFFVVDGYVSLDELTCLLTTADGVPEEHAIEKRHTHWVWGSSGDYVGYVLTVATPAAGFLLAKFIAWQSERRIRGLSPLDRDVALAAGVRALEETFGLAPEAGGSKVTAEEVRPGPPMTFQFSFNIDGSTYTACVEQGKSGSIAVTQVRREAG